jgi:rhodanese-related sulfurtransferase
MALLPGENMKFVLKIVTLALAAALTTLPALAEDPLTPTEAKGIKVITVEQANELIGKATFFDFRAAINYGKGHIRGAIAVPYDQKSDKSVAFDATQDRFNMAKLPANKASSLVFYSDGPTGWKSYKAAIVAARAGYTNVKWMRDGTSGWVAKGAPLE